MWTFLAFISGLVLAKTEFDLTWGQLMAVALLVLAASPADWTRGKD